MKKFYTAVAAIAIAAPVTIGAALPAQAATQTSYSCSGYGNCIWFKVWSGKVQTTGARKGYWPLYGHMSGYVLNQSRTTSFIPKRMVLGGQVKSVKGVQVTWLKKGYVSASVAEWELYNYTPPKRVSKALCNTVQIRAAG